MRAFPDKARRDAGYQLHRVQRGLELDDWKPVPTIGPGAREIRIRDVAGAFRVICLATLLDVVRVLRAFGERVQETAKRDRALAASRLRASFHMLLSSAPRIRSGADRCSRSPGCRSTRLRRARAAERRGKLGIGHHVGAIAYEADHAPLRRGNLDPHRAGRLVAHARMTILHVEATLRGLPQRL
jgi:phage-related protein